MDSNADFDGTPYMSRIPNRECVAVYNSAVDHCIEAEMPTLNSPRSPF